MPRPKGPPRITDIFQFQKDRAKARGIKWDMTFDQWFKIWTESGHLHERGCRKGQYVMARFGDKGPYAIGNVKICTVEENRKEVKMSDEGRAKISKIKKGNQYTLGKTWKHSAQAIENMRVAAFKREERKRDQRMMNPNGGQA